MKHVIFLLVSVAYLTIACAAPIPAKKTATTEDVKRAEGNKVSIPVQLLHGTAGKSSGISSLVRAMHVKVAGASKHQDGNPKMGRKTPPAMKDAAHGLTRMMYMNRNLNKLKKAPVGPMANPQKAHMTPPAVKDAARGLTRLMYLNRNLKKLKKATEGPRVPNLHQKRMNRNRHNSRS